MARSALLRHVVTAWLVGFALIDTAVADSCAGVDPVASQPLRQVTLPPVTCKVHTKNGLSLPDPSCTPGAINPTVTLDVLRGGVFHTPCVRDKGSSATQKIATYNWYRIKKPVNNSGAQQRCELDHLISIELGGADTLDNIWPQCGPARSKGLKRYFKQKDLVENYLAAQVKRGGIDLHAAQVGIAIDWTQYLDAAISACRGKVCKKGELDYVPR